MKITLIYKLNIIIFGLFVGLTATAQEQLQKLQEKIKVADDVVIRLNSTHTTVLIETWNQNTVSVEAFLEGVDIAEAKNKEQLLQNWKVSASSSKTKNEITINSITGNFWSGEVAVASNQRNNAASLGSLSPMIAEMLRPILKQIEDNPMPSALSQNLASMNFDNRAYQENEEKYIKQWSDQIKEKFGDNSENVIRGWAQQLSTHSDPVNTVPSVASQNWGGGEFAEQMQVWASQFSGSIAFTQQNGSNITVYKYASTANVKNTERILKIKVPVNAQLKFSMRHGNLKLPSKLTNVAASLSHTSLEAEKVTGTNTMIKVAYAPVYVKEWSQGRLVINYVKNCRIQNAVDLRVHSDSSNIFINELVYNASINGSFGAFTIAKLSEKFNTLDLAIENSDFKLKLPESAFNFAYSGTQSRIAIPKTIEVSARKNFGNVFVNGFQKTRNTEKTITIQATYSDIDLH